MVMKKLILFFLSLFLGGLSLPNMLTAQEPAPHRYGVALFYTPLTGIGLEGAVDFIPELTARVGLSGIGYPFGWSISASNLNLDYQQHFDYDPTVNFKLNYRTVFGHIFLDYQPIPAARWLHFTGGFLLGRSMLSSHLQLIDPKTGRSALEGRSDVDPNSLEVSWEDDSGNPYVFNANPDASMDLSVKMGNIVKPYLGIGFGHSVPKGRVSFRGELGIVYSGALKFSSSNVLKGDINEFVKGIEEMRTFLRGAQWIPVLNLGVTVRIH